MKSQTLGIFSWSTEAEFNNWANTLWFRYFTPFLADVDMRRIYREVKVCLPAPQILSKNLEQKVQTDKHFQLSEAFLWAESTIKLILCCSPQSLLLQIVPYGNSSALMLRLCFISALYSQTWSCSCLNMLDQNSVGLVFKRLYVKHLDSTK